MPPQENNPVTVQSLDRAKAHMFQEPKAMPVYVQAPDDGQPPSHEAPLGFASDPSSVDQEYATDPDWDRAFEKLRREENK